MEQQKLRALCIRTCFDGGQFERERLIAAGIKLDEKEGVLCHQYIHSQIVEIDPRNPIAVHFQFEQDPHVEHNGFKFDKEKMQYVQINPGPTQAQLDKRIADAIAENKRLAAEAELKRLKDENEALKASIRGEEQKAKASE